MIFWISPKSNQDIFLLKAYPLLLWKSQNLWNPHSGMFQNPSILNLLSNSFKFTEKGGVKLKIYKAIHNPIIKNAELDDAKMVVAFEITDSGIGISKEKQNIIFEAFQQAEGSTSRKYGGTGLGLSISRGLADLLGGIIELESELGE